MKKSWMFLGACIISPWVFACGNVKIPLDRIDFQLSAKSWVVTEMVQLMVDVHVSSNHSDLVRARDQILQSLNAIVKGDWHITQFDRAQDSSGLDTLYVAASLRVAQGSVADVYARAKKVSQPGATYTISGMDFKPDIAEIEQTKQSLRQKLYGMVRDEMQNMNTIYPYQHYTVHKITLSEGNNPPLMQAKAASFNKMVMQASPPLPVSNEIIMSAYVQAASNRAGDSSVKNTTTP